MYVATNNNKKTINNFSLTLACVKSIIFIDVEKEKREVCVRSMYPIT